MPNVKTLQRSFGGGEMSPEMFGRIDDVKFQSGLATCRNFITKPQGAAETRPGFEFVREVKDSTKSTRLIPFTYSTTQTMVIEMGAGYFRFHTQGATLLVGSPAAYNSGTAYVIGSLVSSGGNNYYCIANTTGNAPPNATYWYLIPTAAYEIPNPYAEADLFQINHVQSSDVLTLVHPNYPPKELRRAGATNWQLINIAFSSPLAAPTGVSASATGHSTAKYTYTYKVTAVLPDLFNESVASSSASASGNLLEAGGIVTISWSAVSGAGLYNVYKLQGGLYGYIGQTDGTSIIDDNISPDMSVTPPVYETVFNSSNNYPGAVSYYEQRRCFAGTINEPQKIWMTKSGTESNMSYSLPLKDDDRIQFRVAAREANTIRHIVPLSQLLLLTSSAEWRVTSVNSDAITPTSISVQPQSYVGASIVQPVIINNSLIYHAARGGHVRELGYNWQASGFVTGDVSIRATHLFDGYDIVDMAYAKAPEPIIWMTSSSGRLLGFTYIPEQGIGAWHRHDTTVGTFESVTTVAEGDEDRAYVIVKRTIDGNEVRYIERMSSRLFGDPENAFFVDSGLTYNGANTTATTVTIQDGSTWGPGESLTLFASSGIFNYPGTSDVGDAIVFTDANGDKYRLIITSVLAVNEATAITDKVLPESLQDTATATWSFARNALSGLTHLEGQVVNILADGAVHPQRTVTSGAITLDRAYSIIHVGLPIQADLQTLPVAMQVDGSLGQGRYKNVNKAWIRVYRSSGIFVGPDENNLVEAKQRTDEPYGTPPRLKSEEIMVLTTPKWADSGQVYVRQSDPLPLTVIAMTLEVAVGG